MDKKYEFYGVSYGKDSFRIRKALGLLGTSYLNVEDEEEAKRPIPLNKDLIEFTPCISISHSHLEFTPHGTIKVVSQS